MLKKLDGGQVTFRITSEEQAQVKRIATSDERKTSDVARRLFRHGLAKALAARRPARRLVVESAERA